MATTLKPSILRRLLIATVSCVALLGVAAPSYADRTGDVVAGVVLGGLVGAALVSHYQPAPTYRYAPAPVYLQPPPPVVYPAPVYPAPVYAPAPVYYRPAPVWYEAPHRRYHHWHGYDGNRW